MSAGRLALWAASIAVITGAACSSGGLLSRLTQTPSPREQYAESLRSANLHVTGMGAGWLRAGDMALAQPLIVTLPFRESAYFPADRPTATAYRFELKRGRRLEIEVRVESLEQARLFVDVFEVRGVEAPARVASLSESSTLMFDVPRDGVYLVRVQPELLKSGRYTLIERTLTSLRFPVEGLTADAVQSEFGAERESGRRKHEGIDIFAPRHTPVVAVVDGYANPDTNNLGGNVVWLRDGGSRRSFYYAHLQRWAFEGSMPVTTGQVLGYVGNTGNARGTAPHLHFGIYQGGPIDPFPFLQPDDPVPPEAANTDRLSHWVRVTTARTTLRAGAGRESVPIAELSRESAAMAMATTGRRLRVVLPDGRSGYVDNAVIAVATTPLRERRVQSTLPVRDRPALEAPAVTTIEKGSPVQVLGRFGNFDLVRTGNGDQGWLIH